MVEIYNQDAPETLGDNGTQRSLKTGPPAETEGRSAQTINSIRLSGAARRRRKVVQRTSGTSTDAQSKSSVYNREDKEFK